ncbi:hypothetical protein BD626DRAFT_574668 [Schizophyllum amplum]|uniref:Uncharacterized protein n=1 Tax=Schizophyllum amplum TaxID=97359 RepID=A0A550BXV2_9AGAR|nr:hypothetical protein BD626DRAFT_574668 [Auriculariopsis ampla]
MCRICNFANCTSAELLTEVLRTGKTYDELREEYKTELAALNEQYRKKAMFDLRMKNLEELCPEVFATDEEGNVGQLTVKA